MPEKYYQSKLYPFQDRVLKAIECLDVDFYLTGGTALGRCYLNHRHSDDLDFFVNSHNEFKKQCNIAVNSLKDRWGCELAATSETFVRVFVHEPEIALKIDFVNDVPFHYGEFQRCSIFHRVDSWRNILSNKLCALSRLEVKDISYDLDVLMRK